MFTMQLIAEIHTEARSSFMPRDARHEYIQYLDVILQYRAACSHGPNSPVREVCREAIKKARELRNAL